MKKTIISPKSKKIALYDAEFSAKFDEIMAIFQDIHKINQECIAKGNARISHMTGIPVAKVPAYLEAKYKNRGPYVAIKKTS